MSPTTLSGPAWRRRRRFRGWKRKRRRAPIRAGPTSESQQPLVVGLGSADGRANLVSMHGGGSVGGDGGSEEEES
jgi:hypothetical protein